MRRYTAGGRRMRTTGFVRPRGNSRGRPGSRGYLARPACPYLVGSLDRRAPALKIDLSELYSCTPTVARCCTVPFLCALTLA
jgi:hypothetical protein